MKRTSATFDERSWSPSAAPMSMGPKADSADLQPVASEKSPIRPDHSHWLAGGYSQKLGGKFAQGFCDATVKFSAIGYDQHGSPFGDTSVTWSATGGTIDQAGRFSAEEIGDFRVDARSDSFVGTATISVQTAPPPPPPPGKGCAWQGTVPPQKWMNFYTKVLSPLVSTTPGSDLLICNKAACVA